MKIKNEKTNMNGMNSMRLKGLKIGFAITGSFCTFSKVPDVMKNLMEEGAEILPIFSYSTDKMDTRFGECEKFKAEIEKISGNKVISNIIEAEPIGPKKLLDILAIVPCTGNTIAKIANAITDTPITMACKAHLRNGRPVIISISTNDGLGINAKNIGELVNMKNIYIVPFGQDDPENKPNSLISQNALLVDTILEALEGRQRQPLLL